jgi:hypothetical protein
MCEMTEEEIAIASVRNEETQQRREALWKHICRNTIKDENGEPILRVSLDPLLLLQALL